MNIQEFRDQQWVRDRSAYDALVTQGYHEHASEMRHGVRWYLMVLPWETV